MSKISLEEKQDFYQKSFRVNLALQVLLYLLDEMSSNQLYKYRVKQLVEDYKKKVKSEIDRVTLTFQKEENDNYSKIAYELFQEFELVKLEFTNNDTNEKTND